MSKSINTGAAPSVPTVRYRVLAIVFFVLAVAGLFLGYLGNYVDLFKHSNATLYWPIEGGIALNEGTPLAGTLFGYVFAMAKYFFTGGLVFSGQTVGYIVMELVGLVQVLLIPVAVLLSLALGITSCLTKGQTARNSAMVSGYMVATAYLWPLLTVIFLGIANPEIVPSLTFGKDFLTLAFDLPLLIVGGMTILIIAVTSIARRKWVGFINCILGLLLAVATLALIYPKSATADYVTNVILGSQKGVYQIVFLILIGLLAFNSILAIFRINAKKFYPFDAVRYGLLFLAVVAVDVVFIIKMTDSRWAIFTEYTLATCTLLGATLLALILSSINVIIVAKRRQALRARQLEAALAEDSLDRDDNVEEAIANTAPAAAPAAPMFPPYNYPVPVAAEPSVVPYPVPYPIPQPAPQPAPQQPSGPIIIQQPMPMPQPQAPIIFQQPAAPQPPVIVLTIPNVTPQQAAPQPTYQQITPVAAEKQPELSDFEKRMLANLQAANSATPAATQAPAAAANTATPAAQQAQPAYTAPVNTKDAFFATLTREEQEEFTNLFIKKTNGEFNLPTYTVGADNSAFFTRVFSQLGKFRSHISGNLLDKIYTYTKS